MRLRERLHWFTVPPLAGAALIRPVLEQDRFDLVDTQYRREGGRWVLRIFIDRIQAEGKSKPAGITLDDCEKVSRTVGDLLDGSDAVTGAYTLEVSSPGVNRPLKRAEDFRRFVGQKVKVTLFSPLAESSKQRNFAGPLLKAGDQGIEVDDIVSGKTEIPIASIAKANLDLI
jgi:ribosome maturation factor RimP